MAGEDFDAEKAITRIGDIINQPDKMGDLIKLTLEKSKTAEQAIQSVIIALLSSNESIKTEIVKIIQKYADDDWSATRNKAIRWILVFIAFVISNGITLWLAKK